MKRTQFGWMTKDDIIVSYNGGFGYRAKQVLIFKVVSRTHDIYKKRIVYQVQILDNKITENFEYYDFQVKDMECTGRLTKVKRSKGRYHKRTYWKMDEDEVRKHLIMEKI